MATEIRVPTLGESVTEATIGKWFKKVGDAVKADEPAGRARDRQGDAGGQRRRLPACSARSSPRKARRSASGALLGTIAAGDGQGGRRSAADRPKRRRSLLAAATRCLPPRSSAPADQGCRFRSGRFPPARSAESGVAGRSKVAGLRQGWPRHQGRHAGCDRRPARPSPAAAPAAPVQAPRPVGPGGRRLARRAREDDASLRQTIARRLKEAQNNAAHADHLQRGGHDQRHGAAQPVQGRVREEARREARLHGLLHQGRACRR